MITFGSLSFPAPDFGYKTKIEMPLDILETDDGNIAQRDEGTQFDKRLCTIDLILTETEMAALNNLISNSSRGQNIVLTLPSNSGFFPFGPDKGDTGNFTVAARIVTTGRIQDNPFRKFKVQLALLNVGTYPSYSLPVQVNEGAFTFGSISCLRQPNALFQPDQVYNVSVDFTENSTPMYTDRGQLADYAVTKMSMPCNESKAAALLDYLISTARVNDIPMITPDYFYPFGRDHASPFTVQLSSAIIETTHENYDKFNFELSLRLK